MKFYPYKRGAGVATLKGGGWGGGGRGRQSFGVVFQRKLEVLAKLMKGGVKSVHPLTIFTLS